MCRVKAVAASVPQRSDPHLSVNASTTLVKCDPNNTTAGTPTLATATLAGSDPATAAEGDDDSSISWWEQCLEGGSEDGCCTVLVGNRAWMRENGVALSAGVLACMETMEGDGCTVVVSLVLSISLCSHIRTRGLCRHSAVLSPTVLRAVQDAFSVRTCYQSHHMLCCVALGLLGGAPIACVCDQDWIVVLHH